MILSEGFVGNEQPNTEPPVLLPVNPSILRYILLAGKSRNYSMMQSDSSVPRL
jgi:hypothetical protein